jgi:hypothetical protein
MKKIRITVVDCGELREYEVDQSMCHSVPVGYTWCSPDLKSGLVIKVELVPEKWSST